jgi:F-type H+-transporting ATPase subunit b
MLIDWFTVIAQIINFLILLFLLHRFLYKPILKTIDKRQHQLESQWQSVREEQEKAEAEAQAHRQAQQDLDEQRDQILEEAKSEAQEMRRAEMQQMRAEIEQKRQEWQQALKEEQQSLLADLQQQFGHQIVAIAHRMLKDLANVELEQQAIQEFQQKLHALDPETRRAIADAFAHHEQAITVQTSFELPAASQESLRQTLQETNLLNGQAVHFAVSPDLLFGIRLHNEAYDLAWNAEDYLRDLEKVVNQAMPTAAASVEEN